MNRSCVLVILFLETVVFLAPGKVLAVSILISKYPSEINSLESYEVDANISGAADATNYLRIDLYKEGTNNYFGETFNGTDWYSGSEGKNYFPIQIQNSSASANLQVRLGSPTVTDYPGPGIYKLKIRRYTASGNPSADDQNSTDVQINYIFPISTPEPVGETTPQPSSAKTSTPVPVPTKTPNSKPSPTKTLEATPEVLAEAVIDQTPTPTATPLMQSEGKDQNKFPFVAVVLIAVGLGFVGTSCYLAFNKKGQTLDKKTLV